MTKSEFHAAIQTERERQIEKWGDQAHHPSRWLSILVEEIGEVASEIVKDIVCDNANSSMESELIQAVAVIEAWMTQEHPDDIGDADCHLLAIIISHVGRLAKLILESESGLTEEQRLTLVSDIAERIKSWGDA